MRSVHRLTFATLFALNMLLVTCIMTVWIGFSFEADLLKSFLAILPVSVAFATVTFFVAKRA